ncbi:MAG: hypothetical protein PHQ40_08820 [Anaerolineaceae bacterium]|nr:hypothetical protein [Anaerolineaceae bacterium]
MVEPPLYENRPQPTMVVQSALALRGWEYYSIKDYPKAEESFRGALQENPDDIDSLYALAMTLRYAGQLQSAVKVFREVMDQASAIQNSPRARMVRRLALGHINQIEIGDWNLEKEVWSKKH